MIGAGAAAALWFACTLLCTTLTCPSALHRPPSCPQKTLKERFKTTKYIPFNPVDKFTCATILDNQTGKSFRVLKGSPQVVLNKAHNKDELNSAVNAKMVEYANRGFRSLGIAYADVSIFGAMCSGHGLAFLGHGWS